MNINAREIAASALMEITAEGAYNTILLRRILRQNGAMKRQDRAFVTEVVNGSLRNLLYLDFVLDRVSSLPTKKMKPWVLAVLRTAAYQLLFMDRVPASAVCNEAVGLIKKRGMGKLTGFVNGILRSLERNGAPELPKEEYPTYLSLKYSHPLWLVKLWLAAYGTEFTEELLAANNRAPKLSAVTNTLKTDRASLMDELTEAGAEAQPGNFHSRAMHLKKTSDLTRLEAFEEGKFFIQDESSMTAVAVLDPKPGERVLDVCAAPGGKSLLSAICMENKGTVVSRDIYPHKLELLEDMAARLGISIIQTEEKDAAVFDSADENIFDRVLVDAPCTGFGLIRKKPDVKYNRTGSDIDALSALQWEILQQAARCVRPGGVLVYSTCTLCKKENVNNRKRFLEIFTDFYPDSLTPYLPQGMTSPTAEEGWMELYPHIHGTDGFFIARFVRKED